MYARIIRRKGTSSFVRKANLCATPLRQSCPLATKEKKPCRIASAEADDAHLQGPHTPDPDLELALNTLHIFKLNAFPPASSRRLPPEEKQFLRHTNGIAAHFIASNIAAQACQCQTTNDRLVRLACSVTPCVVMIETAGDK